MIAFILILALGAVMVFATSLLHYEVLRLTWDLIPKLKLHARFRIMPVIIAIFASHTVGVWLYAGLYRLLEKQGGFGSMVMEGIPQTDFITALYFSAITYSTVGYGDVLPTGWLRILAGIEALNGLVLIGWSISFTYLALQHLWETHKKR